jgi:hypothetical protein
MKLQFKTWLLLLSALLLGIVIYTYEIHNKQTIIEQKTQKQLFNVAENEISKISIDRANSHLEFIKTDNKDAFWKMKKPELSTANEATITFLLNLFANGKKERFFSTPVDRLSEYGLAKPLARIQIELNNRTQREIILGNTSQLDRELIYAAIDPGANERDIEIFLVSKNWQYAVEREFSEWTQSN